MATTCGPALAARNSLTPGAQLYTIRVREPKNVETLPAFGAEYAFTLRDAVDDVPEYLVHPATFVKLAREEFGLQCVLHLPFHAFHDSVIDRAGNRELLRRIALGAHPPPGAQFNVSADEWEAIGAAAALQGACAAAFDPSPQASIRCLRLKRSSPRAPRAPPTRRRFARSSGRRCRARRQRPPTSCTLKRASRRVHCSSPAVDDESASSSPAFFRRVLEKTSESSCAL